MVSAHVQTASVKQNRGGGNLHHDGARGPRDVDPNLAASACARAQRVQRCPAAAHSRARHERGSADRPASRRTAELDACAQARAVSLSQAGAVRLRLIAPPSIA